MHFFSRAAQVGFQIPQLSQSSAFFSGTQCQILNGKTCAAHFVEQAKQLRAGKKTPCLAVILAGENKASQVYVNNKLKMFHEAGFASRLFSFTSQETNVTKLLALIAQLNTDSSVDGILLQLPLPAHMSQAEQQGVLNAIAAHKDVDGFLAQNIGSVATGEFAGSIACTPFGVSVLLAAYGIELASKHVVVVGRSNIVGKPMGLLCLSQHATVTYVHSRTQNLQEVCARADVLIAAAGQPELIVPAFVKKGAIVIDIGIHKKEDGKLTGDVHPSVQHVASAMSPVPGGVGPMTVAMLLVNTALCAWNSSK